MSVTKLRMQGVAHKLNMHRCLNAAVRPLQLNQAALQHDVIAKLQNVLVHVQGADPSRHVGVLRPGQLSM